MDPAAAVEHRRSAQVDVPAALQEVWEAWTTEAGERTFFDPAAHNDVRPGGAYEMLFNLEAEPGQQGGEGVMLLAVQPMSMLSFTWNAPPELPVVRRQRTHVTVRFAAIDARTTRVRLSHDGCGHGDEWDRARACFAPAWPRVILPRLRFRLEHGPHDWDQIPVDLQPAALG